MSELLGLIMEKQKQRTQLSQRVFDRHYMHHKNALTGITEDSRKNSFVPVLFEFDFRLLTIAKAHALLS